MSIIGVRLHAILDTSVGARDDRSSSIYAPVLTVRKSILALSQVVLLNTVAELADEIFSYHLLIAILDPFWSENLDIGRSSFLGGYIKWHR